jgi:hypothetical protein
MARGITLRDLSSSFYLLRRLLYSPAAALLVSACLASCHRPLPPGAEKRPVTSRLAALSFLPAETQIVLFADLDRLRGQPVWKTLSPLLAKHAKPTLDDIAGGIGIDPVRQLHRLWVALPGEPQVDGRFALLAETDPVDMNRAPGWLSAHASDGLTVRISQPTQILISKGAWRTTSAGAEPAPSAADNAELRRLCERAAGERGIWFAALVPVGIRKALMASNQMADVASLTRVQGSLDDKDGLHGELVGEFANTGDPPLLAHRLKVFHNQAKRAPDVLVAGLSPYLEALRVEAHDARVRVAIDLPDTQADDVVERIEALALVARTKYSRAP